MEKIELFNEKLNNCRRLLTTCLDADQKNEKQKGFAGMILTFLDRPTPELIQYFHSIRASKVTADEYIGVLQRGFQINFDDFDPDLVKKFRRYVEFFLAAS